MKALSLRIKFGAIQTGVLSSPGLTVSLVMGCTWWLKANHHISRIKAMERQDKYTGLVSRVGTSPWAAWESWIQFQRLLWVMTRMWLRLLLLLLTMEPAKKQCKGCMCEWGHKWVHNLLSCSFRIQDSQDSAVNAKESAMWENPRAKS